MSCYVDHGYSEAISLFWSGLVRSCIVPSAPRRIWQTLKPLSHCYCVWLRQAVKGLIPVTQHAGAVAGGQAGSAEADLWPLRKGMWKLFHPGQKPKTPGRLESGGSILLSTFLIRGSKQRFHVNVLWSACRSGICHFGMKFHPAAVCLLLCDHYSEGEVWLVVGNGCSCAVCAGGKPGLWGTVCPDLELATCIMCLWLCNKQDGHYLLLTCRSATTDYFHYRLFFLDISINCLVSKMWKCLKVACFSRQTLWNPKILSFIISDKGAWLKCENHQTDWSTDQHSAQPSQLY